MTDRKAPTRSDLGWPALEPNIRWKTGNISTSVAGGTPGAGDGELMLGHCSPGNESPTDVRVEKVKGTCYLCTEMILQPELVLAWRLFPPSSWSRLLTY
jgi:hypothetical protein